MEVLMNLLSSQTKRDALSFFLTFLIYLPFLIWWTSHASAFITTENKTNREFSLDLDIFHKEECVVPQTLSEPIEEKEEVPIEETKEEPTPEEPIIEEPVVEDIVPVPEPEVVLSEKPKPIMVEKPKIKKPISKKTIKKKKKKIAKSSRSKTSSQNRTKQTRSSAGKSRFVARLKAKINANKTYPRIAQKRRMQGKVKVRFRITSAGKLSGLTASGPRIFINSAKKAVKRAFPLATRGAPLPMNVTLTLQYRLKK